MFMEVFVKIVAGKSSPEGTISSVDCTNCTVGTYNDIEGGLCTNCETGKSSHEFKINHRL